MLSGTSHTTRKKLLGSFYTPLRIAQPLVDWAVQSSSDWVFDPSFGGCAFYDAAIRRLASLGNSAPGRCLFGVDIDRRARRYLTSVLQSGGSQKQFVTGDFLATTPETFAQKFQAIVGNPPYVRHHWLKARTAGLSKVDSALNGSSNYWAYFVVHAMAFLRDGGRLAFLLPGSFLFSDYSAPVRELLTTHFSATTILAVEERLFAEAEELSIIVLASGFRRNQQGLMRFGSISKGTCLDDYIRNITSHTSEVPATESRAWSSTLISRGARKVLDVCRNHASVHAISSVATVSIGTVTGCNDFFLLKPSDVRRMKLPFEQLVPVLSRTAQMQGIVFTDADFKALVEANVDSFLLFVEENEITASLESYIALGEIKGIHLRRKCREREPWFCFDDIPMPDAFVPCMNFERPRIIKNVAHVGSTNTLHQLKFKSHLDDETKRSLIASSLSTLFQLTAELEGRFFGGGLLKLEPSDVTRLLVVDIGDPRALESADSLVREGSWVAAQKLIDSYVMRMVGLEQSDNQALQEALAQLRSMRYSERKNLSPA